MKARIHSDNEGQIIVEDETCEDCECRVRYLVDIKTPAIASVSCGCTTEGPETCNSFYVMRRLVEEHQRLSKIESMVNELTKSMGGSS